MHGLVVKKKMEKDAIYPLCVVQCIMCICSVKFYTWFGELKWSSELAVWRGFCYLYKEFWRVFASDSEKAGPHASCRIYLSYMSFFVGGDASLERLKLLLSLLSGRRRRGGGLSSS
jgi:hypothetical protein